MTEQTRVTGTPSRTDLNHEIRDQALREARTAAAVAADNGGYAQLSSLALQRIVYALTEGPNDPR